MTKSQLGVQDILIIAHLAFQLLLGLTQRAFRVFSPGHFCKRRHHAAQHHKYPSADRLPAKGQTGGFTFPLITEHDNCGFVVLISIKD